MKRLFCAVCCLTLASLPALAQTKHSEKGAKAGMTDQQFVDAAGQIDMTEAHIGQMLQDTDASQAVKDYGQMLNTDHTANYQELKTAAQQANLTVPTAIDAEHYKMLVAPLVKLKGAALDKKVAAEMVAGHTGAVALFKKEADDAENPAIKSYAEATVPVLEKHLSKAKDLGKPAAAK